MRRAVPVLLALATVLTSPVAARSQPPAPAGYDAVKTTPLHPGVEYVKLVNKAGPVVAHVAHVLPGAPVDLQVVNAHDRIPGNAGDLETTSSMCRRVKCIAGVNGDFHKFGVPAGAVIVGGRMLRSPEPDRPQLTVTKDGGLVAGTFPWSGSLSANGRQTPVGGLNTAPPANELAVFTPEYGPGTPDSGRVELVVKASRVGALNKPTNLELVALRTGAGPIPADGAVLSGDGAAGQALRDLWAKRQAATGPVRLHIGSPVDADVSLGVEPVVLRDGKRATPWRDPNVINPDQPHTLIGWNKEGHIYLVAVDGRQAASEGVNMAQAADFLTSLGVTDAVSLDGGGGTVFVAGGSVWNRPSDNDPARPGAFVERGAPNAFLILARPEAPAASGTPVTSPAPTAIKPMTAPAETDGSSDDSGLGPTWVAGPTTVEGDVSLAAPTAGAPVGEAQLHAASPSGSGAAPGREPTPNTAGGVAGPQDDRSLVEEAREQLEDGDDRAPSEGAYLQSTLSMAAELASPPPADKPSGSNGGGLLGAILAGSALGAAGLVTRTRARRRPIAASVRKQIVGPAAAGATVAPVADDVLPEPEPIIEAPVADPEPALAPAGMTVNSIVAAADEVEAEAQFKPEPLNEAPVADPEPALALAAVTDHAVAPVADEVVAEPELIVHLTAADPEPARAPAAVTDHAAPVADEVVAESELVVDLTATDPEPTAEEIEAHAFAVVAGVGELFIEPQEPVADLTVGTGTLFEFTRLDGFHRLVLDNRARARVRANRLQVQRTRGAGVAPRHAKHSVTPTATRSAMAEDRPTVK